MNISTYMAASFSNSRRFYGSYGDPMIFSVKMLLFRRFYGSYGDPITAHLKNQGIYSRDNYRQVWMNNQTSKDQSDKYWKY